LPPLEQARRFLQPLLFEEVTEEPAGDAMKAAGDVLSRIAELFRYCFDGDFLVVAKAAPNRFDELAQQAVHWLAKQRDRRSQYDRMIERYADQYGVDPVLVRAVIQVESTSIRAASRTRARAA
jgi:soluble lytic murein transglycosylase-like protein